MYSYIYGRNPVLEWLRSQMEIDKIVVAKDVSGVNLSEIETIAAKQHIKIERVARPEMTRMVKSDHHQGVAARIVLPDYVGIEEILKRAETLGEPLLIAVLDCIQDPGNLGAILRSGDGAGVHGIIIPRDNAAPLTPVAFKASAGAAAHVAIAQVTNLTRTIQELKEEGVWFVATDQDAARLYTEIDFKGPVGLVLGSEGKGVRRLVREQCDFAARIPLRGKVNSLNVSAAAAVLFFESRRQRGF